LFKAQSIFYQLFLLVNAVSTISLETVRNSTQNSILYKERFAMPGHIEFVYDDENDIVTATPKWHIESESDCQRWHDEWVAYLSKFNRKIDCIIILDHFFVSPETAAAWGAVRAEINKKFIRFGYRVNPELAVSLYAKTSGARYRAATEEAATVEDAVVAINEARQKLLNDSTAAL
jgi:hypothetical protein